MSGAFRRQSVAPPRPQGYCVQTPRPCLSGSGEGLGTGSLCSTMTLSIVVGVASRCRNVARAITGTRWSGPLFFGLKGRGKEAVRG
jgi:hypothetical protein